MILRWSISKISEGIEWPFHQDVSIHNRRSHWVLSTCQKSFLCQIVSYPVVDSGLLVKTLLLSEHSLNQCMAVVVSAESACVVVFNSSFSLVIMRFCSTSFLSLRPRYAGLTSIQSFFLQCLLLFIVDVSLPDDILRLTSIQIVIWRGDRLNSIQRLFRKQCSSWWLRNLWASPNLNSLLTRLLGLTLLSSRVLFEWNNSHRHFSPQELVRKLPAEDLEDLLNSLVFEFEVVAGLTIDNYLVRTVLNHCNVIMSNGGNLIVEFNKGIFIKHFRRSINRALISQIALITM